LLDSKQKRLYPQHTAKTGKRPLAGSSRFAFMQPAGPPPPDAGKSGARGVASQSAVAWRRIKWSDSGTYRRRKHPPTARRHRAAVYSWRRPQIAEEICAKVNIPAERRVAQLTDAEVLQIRETSTATTS